MRVVKVVMVGLLLWASSATAAPGIIVGPGVEAAVVPLDAVRTIARLDAGVTVCVLDAVSYVGVVHRRPGWLAIRLPGGDVGYVHADAVKLDLSTVSADTVCDEPVKLSGPGVIPASARETKHEPAPPPTQLPPLLPGRFLPLEPARVVFGMDIGSLQLRDQAAAQYQIGTQATLFDVSAALLIFDVFMISGSAGIGSATDNGSFTEVVVPETGGDEMSASSGLTMTQYSIALGVHTPFWALGATSSGWVAAALFANIGWGGASGSRGIDNCSDCSSDQFSVPGGMFWRVGIDLAIPTQAHKFSWGFSASYQSYEASSALSDELSVGLSFWLP